MPHSDIKGTALESVLTDLHRLLDEDVLSHERLEASLEAADLVLLETKIQSAQWYSIASMGRLSEILLEIEGHGDLEYIVERGRRAAARINESGIYRQLSGDNSSWGERVGRIMVTLGPVMFRDTQWSQELVEGSLGKGFVVYAEVDSGFPEICRYSTQGFIDYIVSSVLEISFQVTSERLSPTRMVFSGNPER